MGLSIERDKGLLVTTVGKTRSVSTPTNIQLSGIKHDNPQSRDILGCMAKLKRTVLQPCSFIFAQDITPFGNTPLA